MLHFMHPTQSNSLTGTYYVLLEETEIFDGQEHKKVLPVSLASIYCILASTLRTFHSSSSLLIVAYVAPFGILSATAFITLAAQCTAVPLDPSYNEKDLALAFEQLKPDLVITFDGVDSLLVQKAALTKGLRVAHAAAVPGSCGLFKFEEEVKGAHPSPGLINPADSTGLILRTGGTTGTPKVVPIKTWAIIANARVSTEFVLIFSHLIKAYSDKYSLPP